jgi:hypothetical protein
VPTTEAPKPPTTNAPEPPTTVTPIPSTTSKPDPPKPQPTENKVAFQLKMGDNIEVIGEFEGKLHLNAPNAKSSIDITLNNLTSLNIENSTITKSKIVLQFDVNGDSAQTFSFVVDKANQTYSLNNISVSWANQDKNASAHEGEWNGSLFNVSSDHSFLCLGEQTIDFTLKNNDTSKITLDLKNFKIDAFRDSNSTVLRSGKKAFFDFRIG